MDAANPKLADPGMTGSPGRPLDRDHDQDHQAHDRGQGRARLWVDRQPAAFALAFLGALVALSAAFSNDFNFSVGFWFVAGPVSLWIIALWYRRQRSRAPQVAAGGDAVPGEPGAVNPASLYARAGIVLLAAQSLIVLLAVDAPVGLALAVLAAGLRLGSRYLAGWALVFGVGAGLARYAAFNRLLGQNPHRGPVTPLAFALLGAAMIAGGLVAHRREARWATDRPTGAAGAPGAGPDVPGS